MVLTRQQAEKDHLQDLKTAHTEHSAELGILRARLEQAEDELKTAELRINVAATRLTEVWDTRSSL
jgi:chromosome segregation ATPase